jgi:hypothetical protein
MMEWWWNGGGMMANDGGMMVEWCLNDGGMMACGDAAREKEMLWGRWGTPSGGEAPWPYHRLNHASCASFRTCEMLTLFTQRGHVGQFTDVLLSHVSWTKPMSLWRRGVRAGNALRTRGGRPREKRRHDHFITWIMHPGCHFEHMKC